MTLCKFRAPPLMLLLTRPSPSSSAEAAIANLSPFKASSDDVLCNYTVAQANQSHSPPYAVSSWCVS